MPKEKEFELLYIGKRLDGQRKAFATFVDIKDLDNPKYFSWQSKYRFYRFGAVYKIKGDGEKFSFPKYGAEFFSHSYKIEEAKLLQWKVEADAAEVTLRTEKRHKEHDVDFALNALEPIRKAYRNTDSIGKRAIEALILDYLKKSSNFS